MEHQLGDGLSQEKTGETCGRPPTLPPVLPVASLHAFGTVCVWVVGDAQQSAASYAILKSSFVREVTIATAVGAVAALGWYVCGYFVVLFSPALPSPGVFGQRPPFSLPPYQRLLECMVWLCMQGVHGNPEFGCVCEGVGVVGVCFHPTPPPSRSRPPLRYVTCRGSLSWCSVFSYRNTYHKYDNRLAALENKKWEDQKAKLRAAAAKQ